MNESNTETFASDSMSIGRRVARISWRAAGLAGKGVLLGFDLSHRFMLRTRSGERVMPPTRRIRFSPETRLRVSGRQGNRCMYCGVRLSKWNRHLDHIFPRDHGGSNEESNLQALCASCNTRKGVQTDAEYRSRYQDVLPIESTGFPPLTRIPQVGFKAITRRTSQAKSTVARRQEIFRTPKQKLTSGSTTAGIILEPVYNLFRISTVKASTTICRLVLSFLSQFFQSRRHFYSQAKDRSTTHRFGSTTKVCSSLRFTTSTEAPNRPCTAVAKGFPV